MGFRDLKLLEVKNITVTFETDEGIVKAVDDVSFHINRNEIVGLVGESGCGKSVTALSILRLIPLPYGRIETGEILFYGKNLLELNRKEMRKIRGRAISMIFQELGSALSPLHTIGRQMVETILMHKNITRKDAWNIAETWLEKVQISDPRERMFAYPYQLSGGMQQRVMIAMALMLGPDIIIADEPTTALDVTIQAQVFELVREMRRSHTSILLITHDMGVIWEMCDRVLVMYASRVVEEGNRDDIFSKPTHPYTIALLESIPKLSADKGRLKAIPGQVPSALNYPSGCHFFDRCPDAFDRCRDEKPKLIDLGNGHKAACFLTKNEL
ncbi:MAG: ABC transporter ATP-binding protein [Desulfobacterales bacterium]|uniref:ABC transporter ATP-binding protein n=1 Tax=Candidatus Desulfaltia bathyphila TaxID=2841697 RepID=A0A8J6TC25_9BACT|nr:ABC transporter ATP-binding protein [Candidatus Desulfaltia bathyphila]MBL7194871.1 ABC transporter ATP-binding protein [Desulfobacterales bacterium]MBL7207534.1 ABC transporter ATP-binding protein [Desulfobacterales bacterium]